MQHNHEILSIDTPVGEDGHSGLISLLENLQAPNPADLYANKMLTALEEILDQLTSREAQVLQMRFGLQDGTLYTLEEIGRHFNITGEQVRQIEDKALRKLRHPRFTRIIRDFLE